MTTRLLTVLGVAALVAGCGGSSPSRKAVPRHSSQAARLVVNMCGNAYTLTAGGTDVPTTCGGTIAYPPIRVTLRLGERLVVRSTTESSGKLDFPVLVPHGSAVPTRVPTAAVELISSHRATPIYRAVRMGRAQLMAHSRYCQRPVHGTCVAFLVIVN